LNGWKEKKPYNNFENDFCNDRSERKRLNCMNFRGIFRINFLLILLLALITILLTSNVIAFRRVYSSSSFLVRKFSNKMINDNLKKVAVDYVDPDDVSNLVKAKLSSGSGDFAIIDVRDDDEFKEGHIMGAVSRPSGHWLMPNYVKQVIEENFDKKQIIVHCAKSQQRGPKCAKILAENLEKYLLEKQEGKEEGSERDDSKIPEM
jgi:rhodanese-related sulfurtransferase